MEAEITGGQGLRWLPSPRRVRRRRRRRRARHSSPNGPFDNTRCAPRAAPRPRPRNPPPDEPDDVPRADRDPPSWKGSDMTVWAAPPRALSPTIPSESEPPFPGDERVERRIQAYVRWNAAIMVGDVVDGTTPRSPCRGGMERVAARQAAADPLRHLTAERAGPTGGRRIGLDAGGARSDRTVRARHLMLTGRRRIRPGRHPQGAATALRGRRAVDRAASAAPTGPSRRAGRIGAAQGVPDVPTRRLGMVRMRTAAVVRSTTVPRGMDR